MKFDYFWHGNIYSVDECADIALKLQEDSQMCFALDNPAKDTIKTSTVKPVAWQNCKHYLSRLDHLIKYTNISHFGFHLYDMTDIDCINFNEYTEENHSQYDWHSDNSKHGDIFDFKMTTILNLSTEPYEGGNFELFLNGEKHIKELGHTGAVICFPSWIQHRVTPVTKGKRTTVSIWSRGPNFR